MAAYTALIDPEVLYSFILFPANIQGGYPFIFCLVFEEILDFGNCS